MRVIFVLKAAWVFAVSAAALLSCEKIQERESSSPVPVRMIPVTVKERTEEIKGFGSLSFLKKFEVFSSAEGVLEILNFREGDRINKGDVAGKIKNPQIALAARRAEDACAQALSALDLAMARLREGEFGAEARLLENEKSREELALAEISLEEEKRKNRNREALYAAGGLSDEAIREERFRIMSGEARILLMKKELEIRMVGLREEDLAASGVPPPSGKDELKKALIHLATAGLRAEAGAARANLEAASRERESCRLMEDELFIKSPASGIVGARYVEEGERIKRDDGILTIMETASLYAIFPVPEADAGKLKKGMAARIASGGEEIYKGTVDLISPQADNQSFTFMVRVLLECGEDGPLKPGMFARAVIPLESPEKITVIPETAVSRKKENSGKVFTVSNNVVSERNVVLGSVSGGEREIVSGLFPGEVVVLFPDPALKEGVYVSAAE